MGSATRNTDLRFQLKESNSDLIKFANSKSQFQSILCGTSDQKKEFNFMNQAISHRGNNRQKNETSNSLSPGIKEKSVDLIRGSSDSTFNLLHKGGMENQDFLVT